MNSDTPHSNIGTTNNYFFNLASQLATPSISNNNTNNRITAGEIEFIQNALQASPNNTILEHLTSCGSQSTSSQPIPLDFSNMLSNNDYQNLLKMLGKNINANNQQHPSNNLLTNYSGHFKIPALPSHLQNENTIEQQQNLLQPKLLTHQLQQTSPATTTYKDNSSPVSSGLLEQHMILMNAIRSSVDRNPFNNPPSSSNNILNRGVINNIKGKNSSLEQLERLSQTGTSSMVENVQKCYQINNEPNNNKMLPRNIFTFNQSNEKNSNSLLQQIENNSYQEENMDREPTNVVNEDDKTEKIDIEPLKGELTAFLYYPTHYMRGTQIQLHDGTSKPVNMMVLEDFKNSLANMKEVELNYGIVITINQIDGSGNYDNLRNTQIQYRLNFKMVGSSSTVTVNAVSEFPFFEQSHGWSSCNPVRSLSVYGLECRKLQIGDVCLIATPKSIPIESQSNEVTVSPNNNINNKNNILKQSINQSITHSIERKFSYPSSSSLTSHHYTGTPFSVSNLDQLFQRKSHNPSSIFPIDSIPYNITSLLTQGTPPFSFSNSGQINNYQVSRNIQQNQISNLNQQHLIQEPLLNNNFNDGSSSITRRKYSSDV